MSNEGMLEALATIGGHINTMRGFGVEEYILCRVTELSKCDDMLSFLYLSKLDIYPLHKAPSKLGSAARKMYAALSVVPKRVLQVLGPAARSPKRVESNDVCESKAHHTLIHTKANLSHLPVADYAHEEMVQLINVV